MKSSLERSRSINGLRAHATSFQIVNKDFDKYTKKNSIFNCIVCHRANNELYCCVMFEECISSNLSKWILFDFLSSFSLFKRPHLTYLPSFEAYTATAHFYFILNKLCEGFCRIDYSLGFTTIYLLRVCVCDLYKYFILPARSFGVNYDGWLVNIFTTLKKFMFFQAME